MEPSRPPQQSIPSPIQPRGFFTGVKFRPIVIGAVVDYVATFILGFVYLLFFLEDPGDFSEQAVERAWQEILSSSEALFGLIILGAFCTAMGGYVAARLAKFEEVKHGALVGAVSLLLGALQTSLWGGEQMYVPVEYQLLAYVLAIPAGALGGYLGRRETTSGLRRLAP